MYESRVTVDLDPDSCHNRSGTRREFHLLATRCYYNLSRIADDTEVRISSGGEGIHLVGWFESALADETEAVIRSWLCDDVARIELDAMRSEMGHTTDVLWTKKNGRTPERDFGDIHAALDHIEGRATPL